MALLFFSETKLVKETQTLGNKTPFADKHSSKLLDICDDISSSEMVISIYRWNGNFRIAPKFLSKDVTFIEF